MNGKYPILILMVCVLCACGVRRDRWTHPAGSAPRSVAEGAGSLPAAIADKQPERDAVQRPTAEAGESIAAKRRSKSLEESITAVNGQLQDILFAYDRSEITADGLTVIRRAGELSGPVLSEFPQVRLVVEGHCDERGSAEYNLGLGDHRAAHVAEVLRELGVPAERVETISYGKEAPQCVEAAESCRRRNRRAHLVLR